MAVDGSFSKYPSIAACYIRGENSPSQNKISQYYPVVTGKVLSYRHPEGHPMLPAFMNPQSDRPSMFRVFAGGGGAPAHWKQIPGFLMQKQELSLWCWAAVASGIDSVRGQGLSQCRIAQDYADYATEPEITTKLRSAPCCPSSATVDIWGYLDEVLDMLQLSRTPIREIQPADGTAADARTDLSGDRPVAIRIDWGGNVGHFVTLIGTETRAGSSSFLVYDPSESHVDTGHLLVRSESELASGYDGTGEWSHVYFVN